MHTDAGFHADQARRYMGEPRFHLATRSLLPEYDSAARIVAHDVERVLADIDADHGDRGIECLRHDNLFGLRDLGAKDLKGIAGPARAWAALRASSVESRFEALHTTGLTALVGREEEFKLLLRR
jgi:hypothetical protein